MPNLGGSITAPACRRRSGRLFVSAGCPVIGKRWLALLAGLALAGCAPAPLPTPSGAPVRSPVATVAQAPSSPAPTASAAMPSAGPILAWAGVDGASEAFAGSWLGPIAHGPDGFLALGQDRKSHLPRAWRSADGLAWERLPIPPTTFGGGMPGDLVLGPGGWLALGWKATLKDGAQQVVWRSGDGLSWEPDPDPSGLLPKVESSLSLVGTQADVLVYEPGGRFARRSSDGQAWTDVALPGDAATVDAVVPVAGGFVAVGQPSDSDISWVRLWGSIDGRTWEKIPVPAGVDGPSGASLTAGPAGVILTGEPIDASGNETRQALWASADGRSWTGSSRPWDIESGVQVVGWDSGWIAVPGYASPVVRRTWVSLNGTDWTPAANDAEAFAGAMATRVLSLDRDHVLVLGQHPNGAVVASLGAAESATTAPRLSSGGPIATDPKRDPNLASLARPPGTACPGRPRSVANLTRIPGWKAVACFGSSPISFNAWVVTNPGDCETPPCVTRQALLGDRRGREYSVFWYSPRQLPVPKRSRRFLVVGHFAHPSCSVRRTAGSPFFIAPAAGYPIAFPAGNVLDCEEDFVITALRPPTG